ADLHARREAAVRLREAAREVGRHGGVAARVDVDVDTGLTFDGLFDRAFRALLDQLLEGVGAAHERCAHEGDDGQQGNGARHTHDGWWSSRVCRAGTTAGRHEDRAAAHTARFGGASSSRQGSAPGTHVQVEWQTAIYLDVELSRRRDSSGPSSPPTHWKKRQAWISTSTRPATCSRSTGSPCSPASSPTPPPRHAPRPRSSAA